MRKVKVSDEWPAFSKNGRGRARGVARGALATLARERLDQHSLLNGCLLLLMPLGLGVIVAAVAEDRFVAGWIFVLGTLRIQIRLSGDSLELSRVLQIL